jgi:hypothetical protein
VELADVFVDVFEPLAHRLRAFGVQDVDALEEVDDGAQRAAVDHDAERDHGGDQDGHADADHHLGGVRNVEREERDRDTDQHHCDGDIRDREAEENERGQCASARCVRGK